MTSTILPIKFNSTVVASNFASDSFDNAAFDNFQAPPYQLQQVQNNQKSQQEDNTSKWLLVVLGVILAGLAIYAGTKGHKKVSEKVNNPEVSHCHHHKEEPKNQKPNLTEQEIQVQREEHEKLTQALKDLGVGNKEISDFSKLFERYLNGEITFKQGERWVDIKMKEFRDLLHIAGLPNIRDEDKKTAMELLITAGMTHTEAENFVAQKDWYTKYGEELLKFVRKGKKK